MTSALTRVADRYIQNLRKLGLLGVVAEARTNDIKSVDPWVIIGPASPTRNCITGIRIYYFLGQGATRLRNRAHGRPRAALRSSKERRGLPDCAGT